jgi:hypothetical protein
VFPARYELNSFILLIIHLVLKVLTNYVQFSWIITEFNFSQVLEQ